MKPRRIDTVYLLVALAFYVAVAALPQRADAAATGGYFAEASLCVTWPDGPVAGEAALAPGRTD